VHEVGHAIFIAIMDGPLPELRTDWLLGRSVLVAENRARRPNEFGEVLDSAGSAGKSSLSDTLVSPGATTCPFCRGQEHRTPRAVFELADAEGEWRTRVVPNMFPAVVPAEESASPDATAIAAIGVHEVIIESPRHVDRMSALSEPELRDVLGTYVDRLQQWRAGGRYAYGLIFKNQGARAGASLAHLHSQFIALPSVPPAVAAELDRSAHDFQQHRRCPYCRLIESELGAVERIALNADGYVAFCPFASIQPFEVWLFPTRHEPFFEDSGPDNLDRLALVLFELLRRIEAVVPEAAYNLLLRTAPWLSGGHEWCHWRIEILPRTSSFAGFELASGMFINSLAPERAASKLRSI
jgi:UDPglucose--hexose-1-phosphate uridylyltransferase